MNIETATKRAKTNFADKKDNIEGGVNQALENSGKKLENIKGKVSENLAEAADKLHKNSDTAQEFLSVKADRFNKFAHGKIEKANQLGHRAANVLENSSDYVKKLDFSETGDKIKKTVSQKPQVGIALAGVFGLLIGLLVGRKTR